MTRKLIYFVRHGESLLNAQGIRQGADGGLSEKGKQQAYATGMRLAQYKKIQVMLVSPYQRTKETAALINTCFIPPKKIEYIDSLHERRNPSSIIGKSIFDTDVIKAVDAMDKSYHSDDFRFADEENFTDLKERAHSMLELLASRKEKTILVITHGIFLRMVVAHIMYGPALSASQYNSLSFYNPSNNASITVCKYYKPWLSITSKKHWEVVAWDDYLRDTKTTSKGI